ncbi:hypothetical protein [uncultured Jatrophihabitans sp.]|uniref:hypothetical protein n=1 Tax=uncultured Jatrophihabitans sp. TaxID=1610747 RepID=UPI0035CB0C2F
MPNDAVSVHEVVRRLRTSGGSVEIAHDALPADEATWLRAVSAAAATLGIEIAVFRSSTHVVLVDVEA